MGLYITLHKGFPLYLSPVSHHALPPRRFDASGDGVGVLYLQSIARYLTTSRVLQTGRLLLPRCMGMGHGEHER